MARTKQELTEIVSEIANATIDIIRSQLEKAICASDANVTREHIRNAEAAREFLVKWGPPTADPAVVREAATPHAQ